MKKIYPAFKIGVNDVACPRFIKWKEILTYFIDYLEKSELI